MRPNYAQDAPPTSIEVGGYAYPCETDYRVWLDVVRILGEIDATDLSDDGRERLSMQIIKIEDLVFGGFLKDEDPGEVLKAVAEFSKGYPTAPHQSHSSADDAPGYSFEYDLNEIIIAIRNQSGIDLSYRRKEPFHWWEFLLEFRTLAGDHYITNLMSIRTYKGKDQEMLKHKRENALPERFTPAQLAEYNAFNDMFEVQDSPEEDG